MNKLVAVIDDEPDVLDVVSTHLKEANFRVAEFSDARSFLDSLKTQIPDIIVLDLKLPDADGFDICKTLKQSKDCAHVPVIMLTGKGAEIDRVLGLEIGADDYVTKPFFSRELVARVKAILRRSEQSNEEEETLEIGGILKIDLQKYRVAVRGEEIPLTTTEFRILALLADKIGWVYSRQQILDHLWGNDKTVVDRAVDVHIKNLKKKLGPARGLIKNVRGIGYKLQPTG